MEPWVLAVAIVILGLLFDYTNGFHDAANVVSTVIATKVLRPLAAIVLAGVLNTIGATQVSAIATTITTGLVESASVTQSVVLCALMGAIGWNIITWYFGIPSSSSYALVGGLAGSMIVKEGSCKVIWSGIMMKVLIPMLISPFLGYLIAFILMKVLIKVHKKSPSGALEKFYGNMQLGSASIIALSHGLNDAQKSMGIITLGLFASKLIPSNAVPWWVILLCALVMGLGTASGGVRIIKTVGFSITPLKTMQGFAAEMSASFVIFAASLLGMPISSTHMIVGSVTGVGAARSFSTVRWSIMKKLIIAWVLTLPASGCIAAFFIYLFSFI